MKERLLIVADLGRLKAYQVGRNWEQTWHVDPLEEIEFEEAHHGLFGRVTDSAGRYSAGIARAASPMVDDSNLRLESRRRIISQIAGHVERLVKSQDWCDCWLAAPKEINVQILEELTPATRVRFRKNIPRDLTKTAERTLLQQFLET